MKILMITENWKETKMLINLETTEQCIAQGEETTKLECYGIVLQWYHLNTCKGERLLSDMWQTFCVLYMKKGDSVYKVLKIVSSSKKQLI